MIEKPPVLDLNRGRRRILRLVKEVGFFLESPEAIDVDVLRGSLTQQIRAAHMRGDHSLSLRRSKSHIAGSSLRTLAEMFGRKGFDFRFEGRGHTWHLEITW